MSGDPARLADEAAALSMLGGRRVVRVRNAGNGLGKLFEAFLESPIGDALVVVEAGDLAKVRLCEAPSKAVTMLRRLPVTPTAIAISRRSSARP